MLCTCCCFGACPAVVLQYLIEPRCYFKRCHDGVRYHGATVIGAFLVPYVRVCITYNDVCLFIAMSFIIINSFCSVYRFVVHLYCLLGSAYVAHMCHAFAQLKAPGTDVFANDDCSRKAWRYYCRNYRLLKAWKTNMSSKILFCTCTYIFVLISQCYKSEVWKKCKNSIPSPYLIRPCWSRIWSQFFSITLRFFAILNTNFAKIHSFER